MSVSDDGSCVGINIAMSGGVAGCIMVDGMASSIDASSDSI